MDRGPGAAACLESGGRGIEPHSGIQVFKKNVSSSLTRKDLIWWGGCMPGSSLVFYARPTEEWFSLSHDQNHRRHSVVI